MLNGKNCNNRNQNIIPIPNRRIALDSHAAIDTTLCGVSFFCQQATACFWHNCPAQVNKLTKINKIILLLMAVSYKSQAQIYDYDAQNPVLVVQTTHLLKVIEKQSRLDLFDVLLLAMQEIFAL